MRPAYFSGYFDVDQKALNGYGAFNISLVTDLPLFIDPFLLFNSKKPRYRQLHDEIITYLRFLRDKSESKHLSSGLVKAWFRFPEVKQTWFGFTESGNTGSGLGSNFATALHENLHRVFTDFGHEHVTRSSHLEKLCLIKDGVGKDNISDFTTNLIKAFLCEYTERFARENVPATLRRRISVPHVQFNYSTEIWEPREYELPWAEKDYVLLTPKNLLTKDDTWINKTDLVEDFESIPNAISNVELRHQVSNYFLKVLPKPRDREPSKKERREAALSTIHAYPQVIDYYILYKEQQGDLAESLSEQKVAYCDRLYVNQLQTLRLILSKETQFYQKAGDTYDEALERVNFLKDVIENKGGHKLFYVDGHPITREQDIHIAYRLTWYGTPSDVSREVDDGRGPADFKVSRGSKDKTLVEFKLASNTHLKRNLQKQTPVYEKASDAKRSIKVIVYFTAEELLRVTHILNELNLTGKPNVVLIDARADNKPPGSKA